jgi:hypothetical protein
MTYDSTSGQASFYSGGVGTPVTQVGTSVAAAAGIIDGLTARYGVGFTDAAPTANTSVIGFQDDVRVYGVALDLAGLEQVRLENVPEPASAAVAGALGALMVLRRRSSGSR